MLRRLPAPLTARLATIALIAVCHLPPADAQTPQTIAYQGAITNSSGQPVNASVNVTFRLYTAASGGSPVWSETQSGVGIANGVLNTALGNAVPLSIAFNVPYYLSIQVNNDVEMSPRQPLSAVPYAMRAATLDATATVAASQISGTIGSNQLQPTQLLPVTACSANQVPKWSGAAWICAAESASAGGTVTSISMGAGFSNAPITSSGTITLANTQLLPPLACSIGQISKWSGSSWVCAAELAGASGGTQAWVNPPDTFFDTAWKVVAALTVNPQTDGVFLIHAKGYLEPRGQYTYLQADCRLQATRVDIAPVGAPVTMDLATLRLFYIDRLGGVTAPQALVLQGTQQVTAGNSWLIEVSCVSDSDRAGATNLKLSVLKP